MLNLLLLWRGLTLRPQQVDPPTVVCGASSLPLRDQFVLSRVDTISWMAGPCLTPGLLIPLLALAFPRMLSASVLAKQHQVRPKVQDGVDFWNNHLPQDAMQLQRSFL